MNFLSDIFILLAVMNAFGCSNSNSSQRQPTGHITQSQLKTIYSYSKKILKKIQSQNDHNTENLAECYQQLGKYTRLMIVNNKRRDLEDIGTSNSSSNDLINSLNASSEDKLTNKFHSTFVLHRELNFYLL